MLCAGLLCLINSLYSLVLNTEKSTYSTATTVTTITNFDRNISIINTTGDNINTIVTSMTTILLTSTAAENSLNFGICKGSLIGCLLALIVLILILLAIILTVIYCIRKRIRTTRCFLFRRRTLE